MATSDDPISAAFNPAAPKGERFDGLSELQRRYRPAASDLMPSADVQALIKLVTNSFEDQDMMAKAGGAQIVQFPGQNRPQKKQGMRSVYIDDMQIFATGDYYEKPSPVGFEGLRRMVDETPVLTGVVMTRIRQMSRFFNVSEDGGPGFEIRHRDKEHKATASEKEQMALIGRFFSNCGWEFNPTKRKMLRRENFGGMMKKLIRDSLTMDAAPIEREMKRDSRRGIDGLYAVDGATVRLCTEDGYEGDDKIFAVQTTVMSRISTVYTHEQLIYEVRNPRTDICLAGYGLGEPETLVRVVTGFLNAMSYNINGFDRNAIPKGLLQLVGDYGQDDLTAFKRQWNMMVRGINNAWSLPVLVNKDPQGGAKFEKFGIEFDEMYFAKWMTFLVSIICSIYGMSPDEINFESFASNKSSLSGSDTTEKLANSKDSGLRSDLGHWEGVWTDFVTVDFNDNFVFRFTGLEEEDKKQAWTEKAQILSVDEARAERGYEMWSSRNPDGPDMGGAPLNPSLIGPWMQAQQAQQPQPGADFGGQPAEQGDFGQEDPNDQGGGPGGDEQDQGQHQQGQGGANQQPAPAGGDFGQPKDEGDFGKALDSLSTIWSV